MPAEPTDRADELFFAALLLEPTERRAFLDQSCDGAPELRRDVERLLAEQRAPSQFIESVVGAAAVSYGESRRQAPRGRIGPYRLIREIGRGGLSSVFLACRDDGEFRQDVALKILRRGLDTEDMLRRFHDERQILARLDHPNIARLLDGGSTEDGLPFFVMEHIDGLPIDRYCDHHTLPIRQRLALFRAVCDAVHCAHQNLIVHRDLKPSNILVNASGAPKLLDFGIAKLLDSDPWGSAGEPTATAHRLMTPAYASPEQVRGQPITTASDTYSLGVLLHELLTGRRPYSLEPGEAPEHIERWICEQRVEPPSRCFGHGAQVSSSGARDIMEAAACARGARPEQLRRLLRDGLDNIVMKALRKEPGRRYGSTEQMAQDIDRYLSGHPVKARPDTFGYRTRKFLRRHRLAVSAVAGFALLLATFVVTTVQQSEHVRRERDRAEKIAEMFLSMFDIVAPDQARDAPRTARDLLDHGVSKISELDESPETAMLMYDTLDRLYRRLGFYDRARELVERSLEIRRKAFGDGHVEVASVLFRLGMDLAGGGEFAEARQRLQEALGIRRQALGEEHMETVRVLGALALLEHDLGNYTEAEKLYRETHALQRQEHGADHLRTQHTLGNFALLHRDLGHYETAIRMYREVLGTYRRELGDDNDFTLDIVDDLGATLHGLGDLEAAEPLLRQGLEKRQALLGAEHDSVADSLLHLGALLCDRGELSAARPMLDRALELYRDSLGADHPKVATALEARGRCLAHRDRPVQAESDLRQAVQMYRQSLSPDHPLVGRALLAQGEAFVEAGDCPRGEPALRDSLAILKRVLEGDNWQLAEARGWLASCRAAQGEQTARRRITTSLQQLSEDLGSGHRRTQRLRARLERLAGL